MNETGNSFGSNPASLKGKLQTLEVTLPHPATNQKHLQRAQQPQEGGSDPPILEGHLGVSALHEDSRCQEEPLQRARQD